MKIIKKIPKQQLEKFSTIFTQLSLVLVLFVVYVTLEYKTEIKSVAVVNNKDDRTLYEIGENKVYVFVKEEARKPKKIKIQKTQKLLLDEKIEQTDNSIIEIVISKDSFESTENLIDIDSLYEEDEPEDNYEEDVPFINIQSAPIFKGCEGLSKLENKKCFDRKMKQFVQRNFDLDIANELGLNSGIHRIYTQFIIDKKGEVIDVKIGTKNKTLKEEANRVINKLPKFKPGKQHNQKVKVKYTLPISFKLD